MIRIQVEKKNGSYSKFSCTGHAGAGKAGEDIVCAGVSALVITTVNALEAFTDSRFSLREEDGLVRLVFTSPPSEKGQLLMDSLVLGLSQIEESLKGGPTYIKINIREVFDYDADESSAVRP